MMDLPQGHATCWKNWPGWKWFSLKFTLELSSPTFWSNEHQAVGGNFCRATLCINYWWFIVRCLVLLYWAFQNINFLFCRVLMKDFQSLCGIKCFPLKHIKPLCLTFVKIILDLFTEHLFCGQPGQENH